MQLKFYKKSTLLLGLVLAIDALAIALLIIYREAWADHKFAVIAGFVLFLFILSTCYSYYDLNADKNMIRKMVANGDVAMANVKSGTFIRFARDARLRNHVYWKLDIDLYDDDMQKISKTIVEKFSTHQTSIPEGFVYVTYDKNKPDNILIIPNVIISSIPEYETLVREYENRIKPKYLNAYYKDGMILQSYKDSIQEEKAYYKEFLEKVNQDIKKS